MEAIKNNLTYDFVKTYKNYCLLELRKVIPEIVTYDSVNVLISDSSVILNVSEKNNPVEHDQFKENIKTTEETKEIEEKNIKEIEDSKNDNK